MIFSKLKVSRLSILSDVGWNIKDLDPQRT